MGNKQTAKTKAFRSTLETKHTQTSLTFLDGVSTLQDQKHVYIKWESDAVKDHQLKDWNKAIDRISDCMTQPIVRTCSHDLESAIKNNTGLHHYAFVGTNHCNERNYCPRCANAYAERQAGEMYEYLKTQVANRLPFNLKVNQITVTLPADMKDMSDEDFTKAIKRFIKSPQEDTITRREYDRKKRKLDQALRKGLVRYQGHKQAVRELDQQLEAGQVIRGGGYAIQKESSDNPFEDHKHAHIILFNVGWRQKKGDETGLESGFTQLAHYFNTDKLRAQWNKALNRPQNAPIDVHTEYADFYQDAPKVKHLLKYVYRYPVWDLYKLIVVHNSIITKTTPGEGPACQPTTTNIMFNHDTSMIQERLYQIITRSKRFTWFGWFAPTKRGSYINRLGTYESFRDLQARKKEESRSCPYVNSKGHRCGEPLVRLDPVHWEEYLKGRRKLADINLLSERSRHAGL